MARATSETPERVGGRVGFARRLAGVSQRALSELVGLSPTYLGAVERGTFLPGTGPLFALADALGVSAGWLARGDGEAPNAETVRAAIAAVSTARAKPRRRSKRARSTKGHRSAAVAA